MPPFRDYRLLRSLGDSPGGDLGQVDVPQQAAQAVDPDRSREPKNRPNPIGLLVKIAALAFASSFRTFKNGRLFENRWIWPASVWLRYLTDTEHRGSTLDFEDFLEFYFLCGKTV